MAERGGNMIEVLSVENMRKSDAATIASGTPGRELMMRAARGVFGAVRWKAPVAIVCGSGNNAGDGYALALLLHEAGTDCTLIRSSEKFSDDGQYYFDRCMSSSIHGSPSVGSDAKSTSGIKSLRWFDGDDDIDLSGYGTVVDCLLGTGFKGEVKPHLARIIERINSSGAYVVSVDINSGLNGDTGLGDTYVCSDLTVSVGSFKPGHFLNMAKDAMASKVNIDIGISPVDSPYKLIEEEDVRAFFPKRLNHSNKGTYGYTTLIGGSTRYSGAIRLAYLANAAMRSGAGVVKVALPSSLVHDVTPHILESTLFPLSEKLRSNGKSENDVASHIHESTNFPPAEAANLGKGSTEVADILPAQDLEVAYVASEIDELISNVKTVAFGMGIGTGAGAKAILEHLLEVYTGTLIVDADGLTLLSGLDREQIKNRSCDLILTPHIKEFSRLTGLTISEINEDPVKEAGRYASDTGAIVLLKGASTIVTDGVNVYITDRGCHGMATAGSGDVLSGVASAVCSAKSAELKAADKIARQDMLCLGAAVAAFINGAAGELAEKEYGSISMIAGDTVSMLPKVLN